MSDRERTVTSSTPESMMRSTSVDDETEDSVSASLSLSALSLFATRSTSNLGSESVISSSAGSAPHTPPSASPSRAYTTNSKSSPYNYSGYPVHSNDATSKRLVKRDEEDDEDEIVLGYTPNSSRLGPTPQPNASKFSVHRSTILKINALTGTGTAVLPALLNPLHHPRSLWTLASHTEGEYEPFVWAIFDSHEHALSALASLSAIHIHPPIAEPALESDIYPFSKLRKVDMKAWAAAQAARVTAGNHPFSPVAYSPGAHSPMQGYSPTDAYGVYFPTTTMYSPTSTNAYSPQNTYPPALYHHSTYHHNHTHTHQSNHTESQEITTTPIAFPMQPQPKFEYEDHSTPIPSSHPPYTPYSSEITYTPYTTEMNHAPESRKHHIDADGGVVAVHFETQTQNQTGVNLDGIGAGGVNLDGISAGDETSAEPHRTRTPHSPHSPHSHSVVPAGSRSPITVAAGSRSPLMAPSFLPGGGRSGAEFPETRAGRDVDGEAQGALKRQFETRHQGHLRGGRASESETVRANGNVRSGGDVREGEGGAETTRPFENNTNQVQVQALWNVKEGVPKGKERSMLDRDFPAPREEGESNSNPGSAPGSSPGSGLAPSSTSFSLGGSFVRDHLPSSHSSSNFTSHVTRPDLIGDGDVGCVDVSVDLDLVGAKEKKMPRLGTGSPGRESECIEKSEWTATVGVYPKEPQLKPTPAETSFSPLPLPLSSNNDRGRADYEGHERRLPPDLPSSYLPLAETRRAPDGDRVKTNFVPASISSQPSPTANANANANGNGNGIRGSNAGGGASVGGYGSFGRFSPMLDRPIQSRGVGEDEGFDDGGRDEMLRGRAGFNYVEDAASALQASALPPSHQTLQQFRQRDLQKQPFPHEQPTHSLSFFHQNQTQTQNKNQQQAQAQAQHQQQHVYPAPTYAHTNLGVAPPTAFRHGDWLCNMPGCGAHNFGRNVSCIMCGAERAASAAAGAGLGYGYAATAAGTGRMQSSGGMSMTMGMTMDGDNELDSDYAYALVQGGANAGMGTGANSIGLNHGRLPTSNTLSSRSYSLGHSSTHIPVIPRFGGQHYNVGAPQTTNGDIAMNSTLVQALGGIGQVAAIQEAIKAHQSQMQSPQDGRGRLGGPNNVVFAGQRHSSNGGRDGTFSMPAQGGQLLIPTTLGNSPPTSLPQGPIVLQQGRGSRFGEARGDGQGRNPNLTVPGMQNHGPPSMPSQYSQQGHPMQQNHHLQHPLPPHPGISASLLNPFSPASAALAAAAIPASKMPALLTPSGRKFAAGGRVQNISRDELNPLLMFWPDNEPLPLTSQIRPPAAVLMALGGVQGPPPPILNTGNKGPIDAQPGDWTCGKCDYLNWRRRRVCANCFPHAEGNTEGTKHSTNDVQERVALLASVIFQQQQQVQAQQRQIQSQQATATVFASPPNEPISRSGNAFTTASFVPSNAGLGMPSQQQSCAEPPRRNDTMPLSNMDSMSMQLLAQKYGYAVPPPSGLRSATSTNFFDQPLPPLNLPPRMTHPSTSEGMMSRGFMDLNRNAPSFQPTRADGMSQFDGLPQRLRSSPPSSRSSFSIGSNSSFYKSANEPTPSPLPLLPAFLQEVVGETSESSSSSVHESPSPPSPSSTSSAFGNTYSGDSRLGELVGAGLRRRERSSPASGAPQILNNIHRTASHSSIWSFGYPGDRKEGIRPV